ncbi:MAG: Lrp/AsnC family transcriptional regulator [Promethearchaeota archaeon]
MKNKLDKKDLQILRILEQNCKTTYKLISWEINSPITTVFSRIKKMEKLGIIKCYKAILDEEKLSKGTTAFILGKFSFQPKDGISKREHIYKQLFELNEVYDMHIISGNWDLLLKIKVKDMKAVGDFVLHKLKKVEGIQKTNTLMVLASKKERLNIL